MKYRPPTVQRLALLSDYEKGRVPLPDLRCAGEFWSDHHPRGRNVIARVLSEICRRTAEMKRAADSTAAAVSWDQFRALPLYP